MARTKRTVLANAPPSRAKVIRKRARADKRAEKTAKKAAADARIERIRANRVERKEQVLNRGAARGLRSGVSDVVPGVIDARMRNTTCKVAFERNCNATKVQGKINRRKRKEGQQTLQPCLTAMTPTGKYAYCAPRKAIIGAVGQELREERSYMKYRKKPRSKAEMAAAKQAKQDRKDIRAGVKDAPPIRKPRPVQDLSHMPKKRKRLYQKKKKTKKNRRLHPGMFYDLEAAED